jgi:membrane fusion protein (multidrug efflux system)
MVSWFRVVLVLVIVGGGAAYWFWPAEEGAAGAGPARRGGATPVVVSAVTLAPFQDTLAAVGTAGADESITVTATVADRVGEILFEEGDVVEAGAVLLRLDAVEEQAALAEARADLADQRQQLARLETLMETNATAQSLRDEQAARVAAAEARVDGALARLADREIRAPFAGVLGRRGVSLGAQVSPGSVITTLDDVDPIKLDFSIPESFLPALRVGAELTARSSAYGEAPFTGVVTFLSPRVDSATRAVAVRAALPNGDRRLRPGMLLTVDLVRDARESLMILESALVPRGSTQQVYRVRDGVAEPVPVTLGVRRPGIVELTDGVAVGDLLVVEGAARLRPGAPVRITQTITAAERLRAHGVVSP